MLQQVEYVHAEWIFQSLKLIDHYLTNLLSHQYRPVHHAAEIFDLNNRRELLKQDLIHLLTKNNRNIRLKETIRRL